MFSYIVLILYIMNIFGLDEAVASSERTCREVEKVKLYCNYIPLLIPDGIVEVHLTGVPNSYTDLKNTTFIKHGWNKIKQLELTINGTGIVRLHENCFYGLDRLQVLKFGTRLKIFMNPKSFGKLNNVETLDLSGCPRLKVGDFSQAVNASDKLPRLRKLCLSNCFLFEKGQISGMESLFKALETKRISFLDISGLQISFLNFISVIKSLGFLKILNISYVTIGDIDSKGLEQNDLKRIEYIDMSHITLPKRVITFFPGSMTTSGIDISLSRLGNDAELMFSFGSINATGIVPHLSSYWLKDVTISIDRNPRFLTKSLIWRRNNVRHLDVRWICDKYKLVSFEYVDISENCVDFIHPSISSCFPNVQYIDLSKNALLIMVKENASMFETLFLSGRVLKHINLSNNKLDKIPMKMFRNNKYVKTIDLSYNKLGQVHFDLTELNDLEVLNLQGNNIHLLDGTSIDNLNGILKRNGSKVLQTNLILKSNPLLCSKCETKSFLSWLISTNLVNLTSQELKCSNEHGILEHVTKHTVDKVQKICQREIIVNVTIVFIGVIVLTIIVGSVVLYIKIKRKRKLQNRENVLELLQRGEGRFKFAAFLAFSNDDEEFVYQYILHQLNENLQLMTGLNRELVCTGDLHFRPGFYVHNEGFRALDTASIVIVVASNNFCKSSYCRNELDQAYFKKKPIVLMLIESIDPESMVPTMRELFQRNVRILWTFHGGEYKMKTTWENVCTSILDLIEI